MTMKKELKREKLTDNVAYHIIDSTIYLLLNNSTITKEEINIIYKKIALIIEDQDLSYINISGKNLEENKTFFQELGFIMSYYDVNKLNTLYKGVKDKHLYKCYGLMTKRDFLNTIKTERKETMQKPLKVVSNSNSGFISNMFLLFGGIILLCYFCVQGALYLVK